LLQLCLPTRQPALLATLHPVHQIELIRLNSKHSSRLVMVFRTMCNETLRRYRINHKTVSWEQYNAKLASINLIVKARNFLVFQVRFN
jgi:hypothetical protein